MVIELALPGERGIEIEAPLSGRRRPGLLQIGVDAHPLQIGELVDEEGDILFPWDDAPCLGAVTAMSRSRILSMAYVRALPEGMIFWWNFRMSSKGQ
jgi:hypothetical protein